MAINENGSKPRKGKTLLDYNSFSDAQFFKLNTSNFIVSIEYWARGTTTYYVIDENNIGYYVELKRVFETVDVGDLQPRIDMTITYDDGVSNQVIYTKRFDRKLCKELLIAFRDDTEVFTVYLGARSVDIDSPGFIPNVFGTIEGNRSSLQNVSPSISISNVELSVNNSYVSQNSPYSGPRSGLWRFTASASDPEDGDISRSIVWEADIGDGYSQIGTGSTVTWTAPDLNSVWNIKAKIIDRKGLSDTEVIFVESINPSNYPSITIVSSEINIDGSYVSQLFPYSGQNSSLWRFTASAVDSEDGNISNNITWREDLGDGYLDIGTGSVITWSSPGSVGIWNIELAVSNSIGLTDSKIISIQTTSSPNISPTIIISDVELRESGIYNTQKLPYSGLPQSEWRFTASATDPEDGDISSDIVWEANTGSGYSQIGTGSTVTWTAPNLSGTWSIKSRVEDSGSIEDESIISINTSVPNSQPVINISNVELNVDGSYVLQSFPYLGQASSLWRFTAVATDTEDGNISSDVIWEADTGSGYSQIGTGATVTWNSPGTDGFWSIKASVEDSGSLFDSDIILIATENPGELVVEAGDNQTRSGLDPSVQLNGSSSVNAISYMWEQISGVPVVIDSPTSPNTTFEAPYVGIGLTGRLNSKVYPVGSVLSAGSRAYVVDISGQTGASLPFGWGNTVTGETTIDGTVTFRDIGTSSGYSANNQYNLVFRLTCSNGLVTGTDDVTITLRHCRQQLVYLMTRWADRAWNRRTNMICTDGTVLSLYANGRDGSGWTPPSVVVPARYISNGVTTPTGYWLTEDQSTCYVPLADFGNPSATPGMLTAFAMLYEKTGSETAKTRAYEIAKSIFYVLHKNAFWQDCGTFVEQNPTDSLGTLCNTGQAGYLKSANQSGNWGNYISSSDGLWNLDEGSFGASISAIAQFAKFLQARGDSAYVNLIDTGVGFGDFDSLRKVWQRLIDESDRDYGNETIGVKKPYSTGGFPEILPLDKAFSCNFHLNLETPWGPYMGYKMVQDNCFSSNIISLWNTINVMRTAGISWGQNTLEPFYDLQMNWILDRLNEYRSDSILLPCGQYGIGETTYQTSVQFGIDEPAFGRPQDYRGGMISEHGLLRAFIYVWRQGGFDHNVVIKDRVIKFGSSVTGWVQDYLDNIRLVGQPAADVSINPLPYRTSPNTAWHRGYVFPDDIYYDAAEIALSSPPEIIGCSANNSAVGDMKRMYDVIEGNTTPNTTNPNFNIGFVFGGFNGSGVPSSPNTTGGGGSQREYFETGQCDAGFRGSLVSSSTGRVSQTSLNNFNKGVRENAWSFFSSASEPNVSTITSRGFDFNYNSFYNSNSNPGTFYDVATNAINAAACLNSWDSTSNVPAVYDSDGDGIPDVGPESQSPPVVNNPNDTGIRDIKFYSLYVPSSIERNDIPVVWRKWYKDKAETGNRYIAFAEAFRAYKNNGPSLFGSDVQWDSLGLYVDIPEPADFISRQQGVMTEWVAPTDKDPQWDSLSVIEPL